MKKGFCLTIIFFVFVVMPSIGFSYDPMNPTSFNHKSDKRKYHKLNPDIKYKLAIARVRDNVILDSPYGKKIGGIEVAGTTGDSTTTIKSEPVYDTSEDETGYNRQVREYLSYSLSQLHWLQLIEREDINKIIREWSFSETKYSAKTENNPTLDIPEFIATGFLTFDDESCLSGGNKKSGWGGEDQKKDNKEKFLFFIRVYRTSTSEIYHIACGTGDKPKSAINSAVADLNRYRDKFFPNIKVTAVNEKKVTLDGGKAKGLSVGTKFYLIRNGQPAELITNYKDIEYKAVYKILRSDKLSSEAMLEKSFDNADPEIGDRIFYYYPKHTW